MISPPQLLWKVIKFSAIAIFKCVISFYSANLRIRVFSFLRDPENMLFVKEVIFLHDKTPCFKAILAQKLLRNNFFSSSEFQGSSDDLSACDNIASILKIVLESEHRNTMVYHFHEHLGHNPSPTCD